MYRKKSSRFIIDLFSSVFKTIIPNNTPPTSQVVGGVTQLLIFCQKHKRLMLKMSNSFQNNQFLPNLNALEPHRTTDCFADILPF